ncbi:flagellin [Rhodopila sp.]|uniref:flagellin n=1 Tax=Rhodopila sp. TaxID=2480087 RepID=UPI003D0B58E5
MSLNSVNTNMGAMVALQSLESTQSQLTATQKQISTGYRVSDSTDDGAAYAIAQGIRSTVGALTTANQQLGSVQGLLSTTQSGLNHVSNLMSSMRDTLQQLSSPSVTGSERTNYETSYNSMLQQVKGDIQDAGYNGKTLIGNITGSTGSFGRTAVVRNDSGATYALTTFSGSAMFGAISVTPTTFGGAASVAALITAGGAFMKQMNAVNNQLNVVGNSINYINNETTYNSDKIDALNSGLGSLIDADLAKESAQLTALQIRQQLGTQSLSMANQAPQTLLSLFK